MNPNISKILSKAKEVFDATHQEWLDSDVIGVNTKLFYPSTFEDCPNCLSGSYGVVYRTGGPAPFNFGQCPLCASATCKKEVEATDLIRLRVYSTDAQSFTKSRMSKIGISIDQPQGELLTIGSNADLMKIRSCNYAIFYYDEQSVAGSLRYKVSSEPQPHSFGKDKLFFCFWSRQ